MSEVERFEILCYNWSCALWILTKTRGCTEKNRFLWLTQVSDHSEKAAVIKKWDRVKQTGVVAYTLC